MKLELQLKFLQQIVCWQLCFNIDMISSITTVHHVLDITKKLEKQILQWKQASNHSVIKINCFITLFILWVGVRRRASSVHQYHIFFKHSLTNIYHVASLGKVNLRKFKFPSRHPNQRDLIWGLNCKVNVFLKEICSTSENRLDKLSTK